MVMTAGPSRRASPEQLRTEYDLHVSHAQHYLRKALEAEESGAAGVHTLLLKALIEQNAAILCGLQSCLMGLAALIGMLSARRDDEEFDFDDDPPEHTGGDLQ